jgi:hypothetical protein
VYFSISSVEKSATLGYNECSGGLVPQIPLCQRNAGIEPRAVATTYDIALQRHNTENSKQIFPEKELRGHNPNFHIHLSVRDLYIPTIDLPILLQENMWTDPGNI